MKYDHDEYLKFYKEICLYPERLENRLILADWLMDIDDNEAMRDYGKIIQDSFKFSQSSIDWHILDRNIINLDYEPIRNPISTLRSKKIRRSESKDFEITVTVSFISISTIQQNYIIVKDNYVIGGIFQNVRQNDNNFTCTFRSIEIPKDVMEWYETYKNIDLDKYIFNGLYHTNCIGKYNYGYIDEIRVPYDDYLSNHHEIHRLFPIRILHLDMHMRDDFPDELCHTIDRIPPITELHAYIDNTPEGPYQYRNTITHIHNSLWYEKNWKNFVYGLDRPLAYRIK